MKIIKSQNIYKNKSPIYKCSQKQKYNKSLVIVSAIKGPHIQNIKCLIIFHIVYVALKEHIIFIRIMVSFRSANLS